jgi:tetratricopeptide (TPR) repeat protein
MWHCADEAFSRAAQISPNSWKALYDLGAIQVHEHAYPDAIAHLRKASELNPSSDLVRRTLADATRASGDLQGAEVLYRRQVELNPRSVEDLNDLADLLVAEKLYSAAIRYWDLALTVEPDNVDVAISRAEALNTNGDAQEAIESLQRLEGRHANAASIHYSLGTMFGLQKRFGEAVAEFRKALELDPNDADARLSLARSLLAQSEYSDVLPTLLPFVKAHPANAVAHSLLGFAYRGLEQYEPATRQLQIAVKANPDDGDIQFGLGVSLMHMGRPEEAIPHLQRAIDLEPGVEMPRLQMAVALKAINDPKRSEEMYKQVRQTQRTNLAGNQIALTGKRANGLLSSGHPDKAEALYREMLQSEPDDRRRKGSS